MAIALVQSDINPISGGSTSWPTDEIIPTAFGSNVVAGNLLILLVTSFQWQVEAVTDSQGNTWTKAVQDDEVGGFADHVAIWYAIAGSSGACTVSANYDDYDSDTHNTTLVVAEFSGVDTSDTLEATNHGQGTGTAVSPGSVTPAANGALIVSVMQNYNGSDNTISEASGYTQLEEQLGDGTLARLGSEYLVQATAGATTASFTLGGSSDWGAAVAAFNAAVASLTTNSRRALLGVGN